MPGDLSQELALPQHFEAASSLVTPESMADHMPTGPDPRRYVEAVREFVEAGVEIVYIHQVGSDQAGFFRFFTDELRPTLERHTQREPVTV